MADDRKCCDGGKGMQRMTTDTPQTNMETLMNFAYAKDKEVHLTYGDGMEDVTLADYIVDHAKSDFECAVNREDVINGDSCWECDCPLAVLNATATQAAELRGRLKKYEDAEESGLLVRLPCKVGDTVYYIDGGKSYKAKAAAFRFNQSGVRIYCERNFMGLVGFEGIYGKTVFLTREEAEAALLERRGPSN
jgi:hypothetical protein